jgi:hypothetical protein
MISTLYEANNIDIDYCNLLHDYIISLNMLIFETYLGDDIMNEKTQKEHFKWCWVRVKQNFKDEGININDDDELYNYFIEFLSEVYYRSDDKTDTLESNIMKMWEFMFNHGLSKSRSDVDTIIEIYKLFKKTLKKV